MTSEFEPAIMEQLTRLNVPTVFLDVGTVARYVSNIRVDYERGVRQGVEHLIDFGHRKIGFISGPNTLKSARVRKEAFLRALRDAGVADDPRFIVEGNHAIDGGLEAMEVLMKQRPTAVLASNDLTAIGALRAIRRAGASVPGDISVIGFDDIQVSRFTEPPLTTVRVSRAEIAVAAFEALLQTYETRGSMGCDKQVSTTLVVRESTGPVPISLVQKAV